MHRTRTTRTTRTSAVAVASLLALLAPLAACAKTEEPSTSTSAGADQGGGAAGSTPGSTPGSTSGTDDDDERPAPDQDVDGDQAIAEEAVLTEDDLPGWTADETSSDDDETEGTSPSDDDESFADGLQECGESAGDLEADYGEVIAQLETAPDADAPDFEQTTDTEFRGIFNNVMVLADVEGASQAVDLMSDERMMACFETEMASDPDEVAGAELAVAEVDLGDSAVVWTVDMTVGTGGTGSGDVSMALYFVQVDRALALFMFTGAGYDPNTETMSSLAPDDLVGDDGEAAIDAVVTRLEEALG